MVKFGFGVDIGGTTIKIGFFENSGKLLDKWEVTTDKTDNGKNVLPDVARAIEGKLQSEEISKSDVLGVGVGVPGPVNNRGVVNGCVNLGWGRVDVSEELGALTGLEVRAGNDANVAALGEMWQGGAKGCSNVIMVTLGTGVGGGIIVDGHIVAGHHGAGGEIGHITVDRGENESCNCGRHGCLEQYVSATGIVRMAKRKLEHMTKPSVLRGKENLSAKQVFDAAKEGDEVALEIVDETGAILGYALSNIACVNDSEVIVIGGGVSRAGDILINAVQKHYIESAFHACRDTSFALASLGNDAGIYGSMRLLLE